MSETPLSVWVVAFDDEEQYERRMGEIGYAATPSAAERVAKEAMAAGNAGIYGSERYAPESEPVQADGHFYQYWKDAEYYNTVKIYWYEAEVAR